MIRGFEVFAAVSVVESAVIFPWSGTILDFFTNARRFGS